MVCQLLVVLGLVGAGLSDPSASIAVTAGIAPQQVLRCLGGLAARGFVERVDAGWRLRRDG